jgi:hypothetical protein
MPDNALEYGRRGNFWVWWAASLLTTPQAPGFLLKRLSSNNAAIIVEELQLEI